LLQQIIERVPQFLESLPEHRRTKRQEVIKLTQLFQETLQQGEDHLFTDEQLNPIIQDTGGPVLAYLYYLTGSFAQHRGHPEAATQYYQRCLQTRIFHSDVTEPSLACIALREMGHDPMEVIQQNLQRIRAKSEAKQEAFRKQMIEAEQNQ